MRRDSAKAVQLIATYAEAGVRISGRKLEGLSHEGLLPPEDSTPEYIAAFFAELDKVHRPGPGGGDRTALVLGARGLGCDRFRRAIERAYGAENSDELAEAAANWNAQPRPDPDTDEGSWAVETEIQGMLAWVSSNDGPELVMEFMRGLFAEAARAAQNEPLIDLATGAVDTPEQTVTAAMTELVSVMYGSQMMSPEALTRLAKPNDDELMNFDEEMMLDALPRVEPLANSILGRLDSVPLSNLAGGAWFLRWLFAQIPGVTSFPGFTDPERADQFVGILAPLGLAMWALMGREFLQMAGLDPNEQFPDNAG